MMSWGYVMQRRIGMGVLVLAAACGSGDDDVLRNGYVRLEVQHAVLQEPDDQARTTTVVATLRYGECLSEFYREHPADRQEGEIGSADFSDADAGGEGWLDRLCDGSVRATPECEVLSIEQRLEDVEQLTVRYQLDGIVDNTVLVFGPLPTAATAKCAGDSLPTVKVVASDAIRGEAADGATVWQAATFDPTEVATGPGSVIRIHRGPPD
jgi:hypothetical protein